MKITWHVRASKLFWCCIGAGTAIPTVLKHCPIWSPNSPWVKSRAFFFFADLISLSYILRFQEKSDIHDYEYLNSNLISSKKKKFNHIFVKIWVPFKKKKKKKKKIGIHILTFTHSSLPVYRSTNRYKTKIIIIINKQFFFLLLYMSFKNNTLISCYTLHHTIKFAVNLDENLKFRVQSVMRSIIYDDKA